MLGLLAIKTWTTYELAQQFDRSLGRLWPSARSHLYQEPKRLVELGLARATKESVGRRPRTVYAITAKGRRALAGWLARPAEGPVLEWEQLLKVFFADHGSKADALTHIEEIRAWAEVEVAEHAKVARTYLAGLGPFPERTSVIMLTGRFLADFTFMIERWAEWAQAIVESWPEDPRGLEPDWEVYEDVFQDVMRRHRAVPLEADRRFRP